MAKFFNYWIDYQTEERFENVLLRFMRRDYDGVTQAEAEALQVIYGPHEKYFRDIREMYTFASGLVDNEYIKYLRWTLTQIKDLKKYNEEAAKEALAWFNIRITPYNKDRVSWW